MDCTFDQVGDHYELVIERRLAHPPEKVWRVLTERALIRQWFPCDVVGNWEEGSELRFVFLNNEGEGLSDEDLRGEVLVAEPPSRLEFTWGKYRYRCEIRAENEGSVLNFTEIFSDPSQGAKSAAGWAFCFDNFEAIAQGIEPTPVTLEVLQSKFRKYAREFASEFGPQQEIPGSGDGS